MNSQHPIRIIGAGMSGLVAAVYLHQNGFPVSIHDRASHAGGRLQTTLKDNWALDKGFQVLLTAYPLTKKYLNYGELDLVYFKPGAKVFSSGKSYCIGNPLQDLSLAWPTLKYPWATLSDKWKLARLTRQLVGTDLNEIFSRPERSTEDYLINKGFSSSIIRSFFRPFFGGIFLEKKLTTSSRMFEFVLKMFSSGYAAVPANGIQQMANQLARQIPSDSIHLGQKVTHKEPQNISLDDGTKLEASAVLCAHAHPESSPQKWNRCMNIYFSSSDAQIIKDPMIGLIADEKSPVTNFHYLNEVPGGPSSDEQIVSVTLLPPHNNYSQEQGIQEAQQELAKHAGLRDLKLLAVFEIDQALPVHQEVKLEASPAEIRDQSGIYYCGDALTAPSLNMAMRTGEKAAQMIIDDLRSKAKN